MKQFTFFMALLTAPLFLFAQLQSISNFGANPGNLDMYFYAPSGLEGDVPVVVALHGCTQSASQFAQETGWNALADKYGFYVIYPEQKSGNNSTRCFNWFEAGDISRGQGEAQSIASMVAYLDDNHNIDETRIFATGFSAGGGMTSVMLAAYPDVFAGGAVMSGLPYKAATGLTAAFQAMNSGVNKTPQQWGMLVRDQNPGYTGPWPKVAAFHGSSDFTVTDANVPEIVEQWTNVHQTDAVAEAVEQGYGGATAVTRSSYAASDGRNVVLTYEVAGMGHAVAIDPGNGATQGGAAGAYTADVNLYSCYEAAVFWGLAEGAPPGELAAPSGLSATPQSASTIRLSWMDNAENETRYELERSEGNNEEWLLIATLDANTSSFLDENLSPNTSYYYRLIAGNAAGNSAYSNEASATTPAEAPLTIIEQPQQQGWIAVLNLYDSGQSFTLPSGGRITQIDVMLYRSISGSRLLIFEGNTTSGTPIFEQTDISLEEGWQYITLEDAPNLQAGQYTFVLTNAIFGYTFTDTYEGGHMWHNGFAYLFFDAAFRVYLESGMVNASGKKAGNTSGVQVFPNPATNWLTITSSGAPVRASLINSMGQLKRQEMIRGERVGWDVADLPAGMYFLVFSLDGLTSSQAVFIE